MAGRQKSPASATADANLFDPWGTVLFPPRMEVMGSVHGNQISGLAHAGFSARVQTAPRSARGVSGLVITQFDYFEMIADYRSMLRSAMTGFDNSCVLVVGYSFGDMEIGAQLYSMRKQNSGIPW